AVRKSGLKYMMFETSCFLEDVHAMRQIYQAGGFGKLVYAEGEYYHYMEELFNDNYSSRSVTIKNHCVCRSWLFISVSSFNPLGLPLRRNGVPEAVGDRDAVEPKG